MMPILSEEYPLSPYTEPSARALKSVVGTAYAEPAVAKRNVETMMLCRSFMISPLNKI
jgi:hypothetical protein